MDCREHMTHPVSQHTVYPVPNSQPRRSAADAGDFPGFVPTASHLSRSAGQHLELWACGLSPLADVSLRLGRWLSLGIGPDAQGHEVEALLPTRPDAPRSTRQDQGVPERRLGKDCSEGFGDIGIHLENCPSNCPAKWDCLTSPVGAIHLTALEYDVTYDVALIVRPITPLPTGTIETEERIANVQAHI